MPLNESAQTTANRLKREARLANELRANLQKRKQQIKARAQENNTETPTEETKAVDK
jgi:hypothetical protein